MSAVLLALGANAEWIKQEQGVRTFSEEDSTWRLASEPAADMPMKITVALKVEDEQRAKLEQIFWDVSDPQHAKYGQHLTRDEITKVLDVPQSRVDLVKEYFMSAGATSVEVNPNNDMLTVTMNAAKVESALETKLGMFTHSESDISIVRAQGSYHLPEEVHEHVALVGDLLQFPRIRNKALQNLKATGAGSWPNQCSASGCKGLVTPFELKERYHVSESSNAVAGNSMAVAEFQGQYYKDTDVSKFNDGCSQTVAVAQVVGPQSQSAGVEAELDVEFMGAIAPEVPLTVVNNKQYSLLDWTNQITSLDNSPLVHSVSYGNDEIQQSSDEYMYTCNTAFMKAGAQGISILFASGDQGVCGRSGCGFMKHKRFHPDFPAGSPYITSVGGTDFAQSAIGDETVWNAGGGGFSDTFAIPDFQKDMVAAYKARSDASLPDASLWNNTGRGYPDIAALGGQKAPYCVATGGRFEGVAGTSASCPVAAGIFAKLNGLRLANGKAPLGFLNPFIYQNAASFQDVTSGINDDGKSGKGFTATAGWDAATGVGTPHYENLAKVVMIGAADRSIVV